MKHAIRRLALLALIHVDEVPLGDVQEAAREKKEERHAEKRTGAQYRSTQVSPQPTQAKGQVWVVPL